MRKPVTETLAWRNFKKKATTPFEKGLVDYLGYALTMVSKLDNSVNDLLSGEDNDVIDTRDVGSAPDE